MKLVFNFDFAETPKIKAHKMIFWRSVALSTFKRVTVSVRSSLAVHLAPDCSDAAERREPHFVVMNIIKLWRG